MTHPEPLANLLSRAGDPYAATQVGRRWTTIWIGPLPFTMYGIFNSDRLLPDRTLHHLLTGYGTDLHGKAALGAWSIAAGTMALTAWWFNLTAMGIGLLISPASTWAAYRRGCNEQGIDRLPLDTVLACQKGEIESWMELTAVTPEVHRRLGFAGHAPLSLLVLAIASLSALPMLLLRVLDERLIRPARS